MRILHITDTHLHADADERLRGVNTAASLRSVLDRALSGAVRPDLMLVTGDLSQDETTGSYQNFRSIVGGTGIPVSCVPGNHDVPALMDGSMTTPPISLGGTIVRDNWCVILLDSYLAGDHGGRLSAGSLASLGSTLEANRGLHTLLAVHHHPLPVGSRWLDELGIYNADELFALLDRHPQVRCVLSGHVHQEADLVRGTVRYLSTPSTCFQFMPRRERFAVDDRPPGFRRVELRENGSIRTEVVWVPQD